MAGRMFNTCALHVMKIHFIETKSVADPGGGGAPGARPPLKLPEEPLCDLPFPTGTANLVVYTIITSLVCGACLQGRAGVSWPASGYLVHCYSYVAGTQLSLAG